MSSAEEESAWEESGVVREGRGGYSDTKVCETNARSKVMYSRLRLP